MCWQLFSYIERKYNFDNWFMLTLFANKLLIPNRTTELFCIIYYTLKQSTLNDMTCLSCHKSIRVRNKTSLRILHLHLRSNFTHNVNPCLLFHLQCCTIYLNESIVLSKEKHNGIWYTYLKIETFFRKLTAVIPSKYVHAFRNTGSVKVQLSSSSIWGNPVNIQW